MGKNEPLLQVEDLKISFFTETGEVPAVDGIDFSLHRGQTLGMVGESGCGKSVSNLAIMRLIQTPPGKILSGRVLFQGRDLLRLSDPEMRRIRGNKIAMIFQEPMTSLNPVFTIGNQLDEALKLHQNLNRKERRERAVQTLHQVGIPAPERRLSDYPHQLSGGMRQRVMIAMALCCEPDILIADEPTTALDVTVQAQILDLLRYLQEQTNLAIILVTHDFGVVAEMAHQVAVMYAGKVVEQGPVRELFKDCRHPYTEGLLSSIPQPGERGKLKTIAGAVPNLNDLPQGCRFQNRCSYAVQACSREEPELAILPDKRNQYVRCIRAFE